MSTINYLKITHLNPPPNTYGVEVCFNGEPGGSEPQPMRYNPALKLFEPGYEPGGNVQDFSYSGNAASHLAGIGAADLDSISADGGISKIEGGGVIKEDAYPPPTPVGGFRNPGGLSDNQNLLNDVYVTSFCIQDNGSDDTWYISGKITQKAEGYLFDLGTISIVQDPNNGNMQVLAVQVIGGTASEKSFAGIELPKADLSKSSPCVIILHEGDIDFGQTYKKSGWFYLNA